MQLKPIHLLNTIIGCCLYLSAAPSVATVAPAKAKAPSVIDYAINVVPVSNGIEWLVTLKLDGSADGVTLLDVPNKWAGREDLRQGIKDITVSGGQLLADDVAAKIDGKTSDKVNNLANEKATEKFVEAASGDAVRTRRITHAPNAALTVSYRLTRIGESYPQSQRDAYAPVLESTYFHVIGEGAWIVPQRPRDEKVTIRLQWELPANWMIANSFAANQRRQQFSVPLSTFRQGLFIGGDFRLSKFTVRDQPVYVALRGEWGFFDEHFTDLAKRIVEVERGFWPDYQYPHYLISAIPIGKASLGINIGGSGHENAFALYMQPNTAIKELRTLLAHELWHNWNAPKFGGLKDPEPLLYWWSEGITDFYARRLLLQSGLFTPQEFVKSYNDVLRAYTQSKVRNAPNSRILAEFWKNTEVGMLPYQRGNLFAVRLDREIQRASKGKFSLDDVMRDLLVSARKNSGRPLDNDVLNAHIQKRLGRSYAAEIDQFIERGDTIDLGSDELGQCFMRQDVILRPYEAGFDIDASIPARKAIGVIETSAAYQAGLRNDMPLNGWSIHGGDASKEIELDTILDGKRLKIKFLPVARDGITVPQFVLKKGLDAAVLKQCDR